MSLYKALFDYQKKIVDEFKVRDNFGLFLDMGLGKTPTSLAFAEVNNCEKVIIVTINAKAEESEDIKDSWLGWAKKSAICYTLYKKGSSGPFTNDASLLLTNYESLFSRKKDIGFTLKDSISSYINSCKGKNVALIIDESHKMKNLQSKQTKAIFMMQKRLRLIAAHLYTYLLTGTPFTTGYIDLYTQLKALGYQDTKTTFVDNFCEKGNVPGLLGWQQPIVGYKNIELLFRTVHRYAITVKSEDVLPHLPEQVFVDHTSKMSTQFKLFTYEYIQGLDVYDELKKRGCLTDEDKERFYTPHKRGNPFFRNIAYPDLKWIADTNGTFWLRARQLSIGSQGSSNVATWSDRTRLNQIERFLEENEDNYVIFYNYDAELIELFDICNRLGYAIDVYCGKIKSLDNYIAFSNMTDAQQLTATKRVIISNFASGSTGMNWQKYSKVIIASLPVYRDYAQALKRVHRPGQKNTTFYHTFYQENWLDAGMMNALREGVEYTEDMFEADLQRIQRLLEEQNS